MTEISGPKHRERIGLSIQFGWSFGYIALPVLAYFLLNFRWILWSCAALQFTQVLLFRTLNESPRWLITKGRFDEAIKLLEHVAKVNNRLLKDNSKQIDTIKSLMARVWQKKFHH